jgi:hypothetical protein
LAAAGLQIDPPGPFTAGAGPFAAPETVLSTAQTSKSGVVPPLALAAMKPDGPPAVEAQSVALLQTNRMQKSPASARLRPSGVASWSSVLPS